MPNWCRDFVIVKGHRHEINEIRSRISEKNSFLDGLYPIETCQFDWINGMQIVDAEWNYHEWIKFYGTKWTDTMPDVHIDGDTLTAQFETAWAPPEQGMLLISENWPNCVFGMAYSEPGMDFAGFVIIQNGLVITEDSSRYPDCGDWDKNYDEACQRQQDFESGWIDELETEMNSIAITLTKVTSLR